MYTRILVPLDGSKLAERVLPHACEFARAFGAGLVLLRVLDPSTLGENQHKIDPFAWQIRKAEADVYLQTAAERLRAAGNFQVEAALLEGKTAETIIDFSQNQAIDLLVISTHGASGLSRWNTSSVSHKVISKVYQNLLIIRAYQEVEVEAVPVPAPEEAHAEMNGAAAPSSAGVLSALRSGDVDKMTGAAAIGSGDMDKRTGAAAMGSGDVDKMAGAAVLGSTSMEKVAGQTEVESGEHIPLTATEAAPRMYRRILLPIDTSRRAEFSIPTAVTLAEQTGAGLLLAAVIRRPELPFPVERTEEVSELTGKLLQISRESAGAYLAELQGRMGIPSETRIIEDDSVQHAIQDLAEQENASLVVFSAHGYTGLVGWPYGSVVQNYIDHGTRPVLVVQDIPRSQVRPTAAEIAAEKYGRR